MIDPVEGKRQGALTFGATDVLVPGEDIATRVRAITDGYGADYTIDAVGSPGLLPQAFASTVVGGTVVCVGVPASDARPWLPGPDLVRQEKIVTGSLYGSCRPALDIPLITKLFKSGRLPLDRMVTKTYDLEDINLAFDDRGAGLLNRGVIVLDKEIAW